MAPRLKVFVTSDGLTDYVVAASSKAKALAAWDVRQDLFKTGQARETGDAALIEAASVKPGEVLRRPAGTRETLAKLKAPKPTPTGPTPTTLKKIAALEAQIAALDSAHDRDQAAVGAERTALDAREEKLNAAHEAKRAKLGARLGAAQG